MLRNIKNIGRRNIECQLIYLLFSFSVGIAGMCTYQLNPVAVDKGGFLRYSSLRRQRGTSHGRGNGLPATAGRRAIRFFQSRSLSGRR